MSDGLDTLARAVLYEGYALYPYRPSALKNQRRFAFGAIYPRAWAERTLDPSYLRAEVVIPHGARVDATLRFLRLDRGGGAREVSAPVTTSGPVRDGDLALEIVVERTTDGCVDRTALPSGSASRSARGALERFAVEIHNVTPLPAGAGHEDVMDIVPASTHLALRVSSDGELVSAIDPPAHAVAATAACRCTGLFPALVGPRAMLCAPIILPDHAAISPHSPGDFFDGTEIDEMLTLRILTMTDAEKHEASAADPRIAALIARTESLGLEATGRLHGATTTTPTTVRTPWPREGTRVRLRPGGRADAFDILLAGKLATVARVERDLEGRVYCAVTVDDDPGADLGVAGMPGHRFYFRPDELEVVG